VRRRRGWWADGEAVIEVLTVPPDAVDYLAEFDDGQLTEVLRLAIAMGTSEWWYGLSFRPPEPAVVVRRGQGRGFESDVRLR
jgi:hypothetical protein